MTGSSTPPASPRRRSLARRLALVAGACVFSLGAGEVAFRAMDFPFSETRAHREVRLCEFDEELGWVYQPSQVVVQKFGKRKTPIILDSIGSRVRRKDREHDPQLPSVMFVGGSFTMGHGLTHDQSFVGRLEERDDLGLQMINLGVQAFGTDQALLRLKRRFSQYNVKAVVYTFISAHVIRNGNHDRRLLYPTARFLGTKPMFTLAGDGSLELARPPVRYENYSYSRVWAALQMLWLRHGPPHSADLTRALILEMKKLVEAGGAKFLVVNWVQDTPMSRVSQAGTRPLEGLDVQVLDLGDGAPDDWDQWIIEGDGHPNARAHRRAAGLIAAELKTMLQ